MKGKIVVKRGDVFAPVFLPYNENLRSDYVGVTAPCDYQAVWSYHHDMLGWNHELVSEEDAFTIECLTHRRYGRVFYAVRPKVKSSFYAISPDGWLKVDEAIVLLLTEEDTKLFTTQLKTVESISRL